MCEIVERTFGLALQVLESVVKNCGQTIHDEVASKQTMEELKDLLKVMFLEHHAYVHIAIDTHLHAVKPDPHLAASGI